MGLLLELQFLATSLSLRSDHAMIRTFIVDDEPLILRSIKQSIEDAHSQFNVIGQAADSQIAFERIQQLKPDVIFTDIRMPVSDGIELIQKLRDAGNDAHIVLLSGYKEFEYAKSAIRLGVVDYLIKPIHKEQLLNVLNKIQLKRDRDWRQKQYEFLENPMDTGSATVFFPHNKLLWPIHLCFGPYLNNYHLDPLYYVSERLDIQGIIQSTMSEGDQFWIWNGKFPNEINILLATQSGWDKSHFINRLYRNISRQLDEDMPFTLVCHDDALEDINDVHARFSNMALLLHHRLIFAHSSIIDLSLHTDEADSEEDLHFTEQFHILNGLRMKQKHEEIKLILRSIINQCKEHHCTQLHLTKLLKKLCTIIIAESKGVLEAIDMVEIIISHSKNYEQLLERIIDIYDSQTGWLNDNAYYTPSSEEIINEIQVYMDQNYNASLSIQDIADDYGFNYTYLCSLFKKYKQKSPNEYIIDKRINKAKELLRTDEGMNIKTIASIVGYDDQYYFSRIFRSVTGMTPTGYRKVAQ